MAHLDLEGRPFGLAPPHRRLRNPAAPPRTADTAPTAHPGIRRGTLVAIARAGSLPKDQSEVLQHRGWRQRATLRHALVCRPDQPSLQHPRGETAASELEQTLVGDPLSHQPHQDVVVHPVKELLQVEIHDKAITRSNVLLCPLHRLMSRASGPEPIARGREGRIPLRLQHLHHRLLEKAIEHRRDAERTRAARRFRDLNAPYRLRPVGALEKLVPDLGPVVFQVGGQILDGHAIDTRRALVAPHLRERLSQIVALDNPVHGRSNRDRRAVGAGSRRAGFGSLWRGAWGFTPYLRPKGQLQLDFLPLDPHEIPALLPTPPFGPSLGCPDYY